MANLKVFLFVPVLAFCAHISSLHAELSNTNFRITPMVMSGVGIPASTKFSSVAATLAISEVYQPPNSIQILVSGMLLWSKSWVM